MILAFPIWWNSAPKIIWNFVERNDLSRKKVVPICTSGNSSITGAKQDLKIIASKTTVWKAGRRFTSSTGVAELKNYFAEVLNFQNTSGTKHLMKSSE